MRRLAGFLVKHKNLVTLIVLMLFSNLLIVFTHEPAVESSNEVGLTIISFFQGIATGFTDWISDTVNSIGKLEQLKKELADTQKELLEYKKASQDNIVLRERIDYLSKELGLAQELDYEYIPAEIIAWGSQTDFSTIVINKGERDGIVKDMPIVAFSGGTMGLVGKIAAVGFQSSVVRTILDPSCFVSALFKETRYKGIVNGCGAACGYIEMDLVKKSAVDELEAGAIVVTSGIGRLFPKEIPIGRWKTKYETKEYESVVRLQIEPTLDFQKIEYLYVLKVGEIR